MKVHVHIHIDKPRYMKIHEAASAAGRSAEVYMEQLIERHAKELGTKSAKPKPAKAK